MFFCLLQKLRMIDREYVKFNTSILTGSNAQHLRRDPDGNIEASIELRLPDNIFGTSIGPKKIEKVDVLPTKMRLSMEQTPIAQLPLDLNLSTEDTKATTCQLDVYPYCLLDDNKLAPGIDGVTAFPNYKAHEMRYNFRLYTSLEPLEYVEVDTMTSFSNTRGMGFSEESRFYKAMKDSKTLQQTQDHMMNVCAQRNHEPYSIENGILSIRNMGTLVQLWQDALENAVTFASTKANFTINVSFIDSTLLATNPALSPRPQTSVTMAFPEYNVETACFWKWENDASAQELVSSLNYAFKPSVSIGAQSISISYDTAAFGDMIPVFWNTPYVNTYDQPEQLTIDQLRKEVWAQPPPKRRYKYGVVVGDDDTYNFSLLNDLSCAAMNLICNEQMRQTFSFLPWIKVNLQDFPQMVPSFTRNVRKDLLKDTEVTKALNLRARPYNNTTGDNQWKWEQWQTNGNGTFPTDERFWAYTYNLPVTVVYPDITTIPDDPVYDPNADLQRYRKGQYIVLVSPSVPLERVDHNPAWKPTPHGFFVEIKDTTLETKNSVDTSVLDSFTDCDSTLIPTGNEYVDEITTQNTTSTSTDPVVINHFARLPYYLVPSTNEYIMGDYPAGEWASAMASTGHIYKCLQWLPPEQIRNLLSETVVLQKPDPNDKSTWWWYILKNYSIPAWFAPTGQTPPIPIGTPVIITYSRNAWGDDAIEIYTQETTTTEKTNTVRTWITDIDNGEHHEKFIPNLIYNEPTVQDCFYILDGTTAEVTIGSPEPVGDAPNKSNEYSVNTHTVYEIQNPEKITNVYSTSVQETPTDPGEQHREFHHITGRTQGPETNVIEYRFVLSSVQPTIRFNQIMDKIMSNELLTYTTNPPRLDSTSTVPLDVPTPEPTDTTDIVIDDTLEPGQTITTTTETFSITNRTNRQVKQWYNPLIGILQKNEDESWSSKTMVSLTPFNTYGTADTTSAFNYAPPLEYAFSHVSTEMTSTETLETYSFKLAEENTPANYNLVYTPLIQITLVTEQYDLQTTETVTITKTPWSPTTGNCRLTFTWDNLPMVVLSPIASIVLTLAGMDIHQEIQPINMTSIGGSSLTSVIPVVENFYSLAQTLRDLHDELVVVKEDYDNQAKYTLATTSGKERTVTLSAKYITKDGSLHQIYIPPNGVFSVQLTFSVSYFMTS